MAYNKTTWHKGDVVSSSGLNNMENGIAHNDERLNEINDPVASAIADGGMGYYDKTTLLNETIPVADWHYDIEVFAEISLTGIEFSEDNIYWIVIDGVATKCGYMEDYNENYDFICPSPDPTQESFPALFIPHSGIAENSVLVISAGEVELPTEPVSFQLIEGEAHKISSDFVPGVYDLVLVGRGSDMGSLSGNILDSIQVAEGSIEAAATKARNGEPVRGVMYWVCDNGYYSTFVLNDFYIEDSYSVIRFGGIYVEFGISTLIHYNVGIAYDESYEITSATGTKYTIYPQGAV